jgi:endonuclease/exonuclease/phosphatase family metal-dependent hydrolase
MRATVQWCLVGWLVIAAVSGLRVAAAGSFTVATFNLENYLIEPSGTRTAKPEASRDQVVRTLVSIGPDVLALQEVGPGGALDDLHRRLRAAGLDLPHRELVGGWDTNIFVAVLSRFPFSARRSHSNDSFLLDGRRLHAGRGVVEVDVAVNARTRFTLFAAHLKSKRPVGRFDETALREAEARLLREHVDAAFRRDPNAAVVVCGDFNDHKDSRTLRLLRSKGPVALTDTRPAERDGGPVSSRRNTASSRRAVWTHFYAAEDTFARFDYILLSRAMASRWRPGGSYVHTSPDWGLASDHRPVVCEFSLSE